jgi:hydrogenase-4 component E
MQLTLVEVFGLFAAVLAAFMAGSRRLRFNIYLYALQAALIAFSGLWKSLRMGSELYLAAAMLVMVNTVVIPYLLKRLVDKLGKRSDEGKFLPPSWAMYTSVLFIAVLVLITRHSFGGFSTQLAITPMTVSISLVFTGMLLMLTRRLAISRYLGFLTLANGVYYLSISQVKTTALSLAVFVVLELISLLVAGVLCLSCCDKSASVDILPGRNKRMAVFYFVLFLAVVSVFAGFLGADLASMWLTTTTLGLLSVALSYLQDGIDGVEQAVFLLLQIGSALAIALFGVVLIYVAGQDYFLTGGGLMIDTLLAGGHNLIRPFFEYGFVFFLLGFIAAALILLRQAWRRSAHGVVPAFVMSVMLVVFSACPGYVVWNLLHIYNAVAGSR